MEYMVIFFTHSGAIKFNRRLRNKKIPCELMPVPRKLSSNCGIGAKILYAGALKEIIDDEVEKVFINHVHNKKLVYEAE
ncbi:MAG: DUF3343 domain-containing protein [Clostridia bacterium]|nr:DUF3343 domain-containing protein [Clostridia bacterium]